MAEAHPVWTDRDDLARRIPDGSTVAIPTMLGAFGAAAMDVTRALIRRHARELHIVCVPSSSIQADMLIGAGCVASIQAGAVLLYEHGSADNFLRAFHDKSVDVREATCPAIQAGLTAASKGLPFMPVRGIIGSDIIKHRPDWIVIDNPYPPHDPILTVPAIRPDVALMHVPMADRAGNLWVGRRGSLKLMAQASTRTIATCEHVFDGDFFDDPDKVPGLVAAEYVEAIGHCPHGAWPVAFGDDYPEDIEHMKLYAAASRDPASFRAYLDQFVFAEGA
jgi:glutaconate CoA-transferase subunit A